jgi:D-alanyl-D-alanine carboxypeptidase
MAFAIGSITKSFTAAGILQLQQDGLLSINDPLHKFLPKYPNIDSNITLKQLMQHTSGIFNYFNSQAWVNAVYGNPGQAMTPEFVLNNYIGAPVNVPGAAHNYSNTNFMLLGMIIEKISGQSYASFVRQRLLDPLQLNSLYMAEHEAAKGVMAHNWGSTSPSIPATDVHGIPMTSIWGTCAADGALVGNSYDLARWGRLLFAGGVLHDSSVQQMTQFMPISIGGLSNGYGLAITRFGMGNAQAWGHSGGIRGYTASLMYSPADGISVGIQSNKNSPANDLAWTLLAIARLQLATSVPGGAANSGDALACMPNPVQRTGSIQYTLRQAQQVEITLQNSLGQTVQTLLSRHQQAGRHLLAVDTRALPAGVYFCTMQTAGNRLVQRWVVAE